MCHSRTTSPEQSLQNTINPDAQHTLSTRTDSTHGTITVNSALLFLLDDKQQDINSDTIDRNISQAKNNVKQINETNNGTNSGYGDDDDYVIPINQEGNNKLISNNIYNTNNHENVTIKGSNIISTISDDAQRNLHLDTIAKNRTDNNPDIRNDGSMKFGRINTDDNNRNHRANVKTYCAVNLDVLKASGLKPKETDVLLSARHTVPVIRKESADSSYLHTAAINHYSETDICVSISSQDNVSKFVSLSDSQKHVRDNCDDINKVPISTTSHMEQSERSNKTIYASDSPEFTKGDEDEYRFVNSRVGDAPVTETIHSTYRELDRNTLPEPHYHYTAEHGTAYPAGDHGQHTKHPEYTANEEQSHLDKSMAIPGYQTTNASAPESAPDMNIANNEYLDSGPAVNEGYDATLESNMTVDRDNDYNNQYYSETGIGAQTQQYSIDGAKPYLSHSAAPRLNNDSQINGNYAARNININEPVIDPNAVQEPDIPHIPKSSLMHTSDDRPDSMPPRQLTLASEHSLPGENLTYSPSHNKTLKVGSASRSTDSTDNGNNSEDSSGSNKNQRVGFNLGQRGRSQDEELLQQESYYQQELKNRIDEQRASVEKIEIPRLDLPTDSIESFSRNNYRKQIADIICDSLDEEDDSDVEDNGRVYAGTQGRIDVLHMEKTSTSHITPTYRELHHAANPFILHDSSHPPPPQMFDHRTTLPYQNQSGADSHMLVNPENQYGPQVYSPLNQLQNLYISNPQSYQLQHQMQQQEQLQYQLQQQEQLQYQLQQQEQMQYQLQQQEQLQQHLYQQQQQQQHLGPLFPQQGPSYYHSDPNQNIQPVGSVYDQMGPVQYPQVYASNRYEDMNIINHQWHPGKENLQTDPAGYVYNQTDPQYQELSSYATEEPDHDLLNADTGKLVEEDEGINFVEANKNLSFVFKESKLTKTYQQLLEEKKKLVDKTVIMTQKPAAKSPVKLQKNTNKEIRQNVIPLSEEAALLGDSQHDNNANPSSAEQLWQKRAQSLSLSKDKKMFKNGKKKQSLLTKYPSDSAMYKKTTESGAGHQSTFKANRPPPPPPHLQPIGSTRPVPYHPVSAQSAPTVSRTDPNAFRHPIQLKPISQEVWTDDGQRISVDINLKLLSPPPAPLLGPIIGPAWNTVVAPGMPGASNLKQPSPWLQDIEGNVDGSKMEQVDMNRLASFPQASHRQQQPDYGQHQQQWYQPYEPEDIYPSPRERLASDPIISPRVSYNHALVGSPPRGHFQKVPPIPQGKLSLADMRSDDGSYVDQYYRQKNKQFTYKVYNLEDYRKMQKEVQLGGLGPEMDSETFKEKAEKREKQVAYARSVQNKNKRAAVHTKPPKFPRPKEMDDLMSKRRVAIEYAKNLPRPKVQVQPNEFNSYQMASTASTFRSPMGGTPRTMSLRSSPKLPSSPPKPIDIIDLQRLHERHEQDKYNVALIRQNIENIT